MYAALAQEPWCFTPDQIARLTDYQIMRLYLVPAAERGRQPGEPVPPPGGRTPTREEYVRGGLAVAPGSTRAHWEAEYDRLTEEPPDAPA